MKTLRDYINLIEDAQSQVDPNKLMASAIVDGDFKEFDLTPLIAKNNWVGNPKQVIQQAEKWFSAFLRQRQLAYTSLKMSYKGQIMNASQVGDPGAADEWADEIQKSFKK